MGTQIRRTCAGLALSALLVAPASAQSNKKDEVVLPPIDVSTRAGSGIVGTSTSVITAEDIASAPAQDLPEIIAQQTGIQIQHIGAGVNGARDVVDMRGFGASATSNVLVLVNGRRFNDFDLQGFDFSSIPLNSIERIEITRGNSGAVLYGDGAVGGVINIVTKTGAGAPGGARLEAAAGSFRYKEGRASVHGSSGPWSAAFSGVGIATDGYRENGDLRQKGFNGDVRYVTGEGSVYFNVTADDQKLGLPGGRLVDLNTGVNELVTNRTGAATPNDFANKQGQNYILGFTRMLAPGAELIVDGSLRRKAQQAELFFMGSPYNGVRTDLTTSSVTPRFKLDSDIFGMPVKVLTGFDYYHTVYASDRAMDLTTPPYHIYNITQTTAAAYANGTFAVRPDTDVTLGARYQRNTHLGARHLRSDRALRLRRRARPAARPQRMAIRRASRHRASLQSDGGGVRPCRARLPSAQCRRADRAGGGVQFPGADADQFQSAHADLERDRRRLPPASRRLRLADQRLLHEAHQRDFLQPGDRHQRQSRSDRALWRREHGVVPGQRQGHAAEAASPIRARCSARGRLPATTFR